MANRDRRSAPHKSMNRRNNSSSSSSYYNTKTHNPNYPKPSNPNSNSSIIAYPKKTTTSSCDSDDSRRNDNDDCNQDFPSLVGTCPFMCPVEERARRERLRDLAVFERLHGDPAKTSPSLAVKKVKFHIISYYHLHRSCGNPNTASMCHLNVEQLMKALTTLFNLYEAHRAAHLMCQNEAEFYSFYLLLHLGSHNQGEFLSLWFRRIPSDIMKSTEICFARTLLRYYRLGNFKRFIYTTEEEASFLQYCIVEPYINEARILALSCISYGGYKLQPYPLVYLSKALMMKESEVESLCIDCGLEISNDETGKGLISTKQSVISKQSRGFQKYYPIHSERIERRLSAELSDV